VSVERIDHDHANPKRQWQELGQPTYPCAKEVEQLQAASQMRKESPAWQYEEGNIVLDVPLPPHAVAAITLKFDQGTTFL
jgi:xylan 1,4-beta-xylosidase